MFNYIDIYMISLFFVFKKKFKYVNLILFGIKLLNLNIKNIMFKIYNIFVYIYFCVFFDR